MSKLMRIGGGCWASIGPIQIILSSLQGHSDTIMGFLVMANFLLYIFPGLILYALGKKTGTP